MRIVSLLPAATEILFALGLEDSVVGVTNECDFPSGAKTKTVLVEPRFPANPSSATTAKKIDDSVKQLVAAGESLYTVDLDALRRLKPDLIVTQDLCEVCAVTPHSLGTALESFSPRPELIRLHAHRLGEVFKDIERLGKATGVGRNAEALSWELETRVEIVRTTVLDKNRPRTFCIEWSSPTYAAGHWVPEMVEAAGGENLVSTPGARSEPIEWESIVALQPEVLIWMPCGYSLARTIGEYHRWLEMERPENWESIPAVTEGRVFAVDGNGFFSRPGPRLASGVEILSQILHHDDSGHQEIPVPENSWKRLRS